MPLSNLRTLTPTDYSVLLKSLMIQLEGNEARPYLDTAEPKRKVTVGIGFNIDVPKVLIAVASQMGLSNTERNSIATTLLSPAMDAARLLPSPASRNAECQRLLDLALGRQFTMTDAEINATFVQLAQSHEVAINPLIPTLSLERLALVSMHFNTPALIANGLKSGLKLDDPYAARAEAWYQIRYDHANQLHKRRYVEAALFGLYGESVADSAAEARGIYSVITQRKRRMTESNKQVIDYDKTFQKQLTAAQEELAALRRLAPGLLPTAVSAQSLSTTLEPARDNFVLWLNTQLPADRQVVASNVNPLAIYYAPSLAGQMVSLSAVADDGQPAGLENNLLVGAGGNDNLSGASGSDTLAGMAGDDVLSGGTGADQLFGGDGNDRLEGGLGADVLEGGEGDDTLVSGGGDDTLAGGVGYDTYRIELKDGPARVTISDEDRQGEILIFDALGERLNTINLQQASPAVNAWVSPDGNVTVSHNSPWRITLSDGSVIELGEDFDPAGFGMTLQDAAGPAVNVLTGDYVKAINEFGGFQYNSDGNYASGGFQENAQDVINGSLGADHIRGLGGNDGIAGLDGDDSIEGGDGQDLLLGGAGADVIEGGPGDDYIIGSGGQRGSTQGIWQPGYASFTPPVAVGPEFSRGYSWVISGEGALTVDGAIAVIIADDQGKIIDGGSGNDLIYGGSGNDVINGGADQDQIRAYGGSDVVYGDDGNDLIEGDGITLPNYLGTVLAADHGNDLLVGGAGNDQLSGQGGDDELHGGTDDDLLFGDSDRVDYAPYAIHGRDYLDGGSGRDDLIGGGNDDVLLGGSEDDRLWGDAALDNLPGEHHGQDILDGQAGNDELIGGGQEDRIFGGSGNDSLWGDATSAGLASSQYGNDFLDGGADDDWLDGGGAADHLYGGAGADVLIGDGEIYVALNDHGADYLDGGAGNDTLFADGGADTLSGGDDNDHLSGGRGDDHLQGGDGTDQLFGDDGNDVLDGGLGADYLDGGAGDDTYILRAGETIGLNNVTDTIASSAGRDKILLDGVDPSYLQIAKSPAGLLSVFWGQDQGFILTNGFTSAIAELITASGSVSFSELVGTRYWTTTSSASLQEGGVVLGGAVADQVSASHADTVVHGGRGDDVIALTSGGGAIVEMGIGDGMDRVSTVRRSTVPGSTAENVLRLREGISASGLRLYQTGSHSYTLSFGAGGDGIKFNAGPGGGLPVPPADWPFDRVEFADGTSVTWQSILDAGLATGVVPGGTEGADTLVVSETGHAAYGRGGDDLIEAFGDGHALDGGLGNDTLTGSFGNDVLLGDAGNDRLDGGAGDDIIIGGGGNDLIVFSEGDASGLHGDEVWLASGKDTLAFDFSAEHVRVSAGASPNSLVLLNVASGDRITVFGAIGNDETVYRFSDGADLSQRQLIGRYAESPAEGGTIQAPDRTFGGRNDDKLFAWYGVVSGGRGDDQILVGNHRVTFVYERGDGADHLTAPYFSGGVYPGDWKLQFGAGITAADLSVHKIRVDVPSTGSYSIATVLRIAGQVGDQIRSDVPFENLTLMFEDGSSMQASDLEDLVPQYYGDATANVYDGWDNANELISGADGDDSLYGYGGQDTLLGGAGDDVLDGGFGDDLIEGGAGNDLITAVYGTDTLNGGSGDDVIDLYRGGNTVVWGRDSGADTASIGSFDGLVSTLILDGGLTGDDIQLFLVDQALILLTTDGAARLSLSFYSEQPTWRFQFDNGIVWEHADIISRISVSASDAPDVLNGTNDADTLQGLGGNDEIYGSYGNDLLEGGLGNDLIFSGYGNDTITGGAGDDHLQLTNSYDTKTIVFHIGDGDDVIQMGGEGSIVLQLRGFTREQLTFERTPGRTLIIRSTVSQDQIEFRDFYPIGGDGAYFNPRIDIYTSIGAATPVATLRAADMKALLPASTDGTDGPDAIVGTYGNTDILRGLAGNDTLTAVNHHSVLDGGDGDDTFLYNDYPLQMVQRGGAGEDVYAFSGEAIDVGRNYIALPAGVGVEHLIAERNGNDLLLSQLTGGSIKLTGYFVQASDWQLRLDGGQNFAVADVLSSSESQYSTSRSGVSARFLDRLSAQFNGSPLAAGLAREQIAPDVWRTTDSSIRHMTLTEYVSTVNQYTVVFSYDGILQSYVESSSSQRSLTGLSQAPGVSDLRMQFVQATSDDAVIDASALFPTYVSVQTSSVPRWMQVNAELIGENLLAGEGPQYFGGGVSSNVASGTYGETIEYLWRVSGTVVSDETVPDDTPTDDPRSGFLQVSGAVQNALVSVATIVAGDGDNVINGAQRGGLIVDAGGGNDVVDAADLVFGGAGDDQISLSYYGGFALGEDGNDTIVGGSWNDWIDGGTGADDMSGGAGDDIFFVDSISDLVNDSSGVDTVRSSVSYVLGGSIENLELQGVSAIDGTGNSGNNRLVGNVAANTLSGGTGADTMIGLAGDDVYVVDNVADTVQELAGDGVDLVRTSVAYVLGDNVENLTLTGSSSIGGQGNALGNILTGNSGANVLTGGAGDDIYVVGSGDTVVELLGEGTDTVRSSITWTLAGHLEILELTGTSAINATGNGLDNRLVGNSAANILSGVGGTDTMEGGAGNDTYLVDSEADVVVEGSSSGTDLVQSSVNWTLSANVENLALTGTSAINGTGNALNNSLIGNGADNILDGGLGNDTLAGGAGNDTYLVDSSTDVVTEASGAGTDTVMSSVTLTLASNVENLTLTGALGISGTGNTLNNVLRGNGAGNTLSGGTGTDSMFGGAGDDIYIVDAAGDTVVELSGEGLDLVQSSVTHTLASNVENLTLTGTNVVSGTGNALDNVLTGNSANNTLTGAAGNDTLDGGTGNDTMVGGSGDDVYVVNVTADVVTELANEGTDTVRSAVTLTLGANVENLTLTGTSTISATGNSLNNALIGNGANNTLTGAAGNDTMDGGVGNDTMVGGAGDDTYSMDTLSDVVTEASGGGTDTVNSSVTMTLGSNVEHLTLRGASSLNGTGNTADNLLTGNGAANTLTGLGGNDTLDGGAGNDVLVGGTGADAYLFGRGWGTDTVQENDSTAGVVDRVHFGAGVVQADTVFVRNGNNLEISIVDTADKVVVQNWYLGAQYQVEEFKYVDGTTVTSSQVAGLLSAMANFGAPEAMMSEPSGVVPHWRSPEMLLAIP